MHVIINDDLLTFFFYAFPNMFDSQHSGSTSCFVTDRPIEQ